MTLPLGVLQHGDVRFTPALRGKRKALQQLACGAVVKLLLRFDAPFWEEVLPQEKAVRGFLHAPGACFPTLWPVESAKAPLLVAWAGGPQAHRLLAMRRASLPHAASESLRAYFGSRSSRAALEAWYYHDWQSDRLARGAYSYVRVGGRDARAHLARPLDDTLFFAGEAADTEGESGTVTGALQSGVRAAREVIASLR